ncbi:dimethylaniline monooxygenase 2 [Colletotrichum sojae]|uniref:Dimethylaniline monooxygenase 2 n=1 Tax=Colletotrichum sojae TaxID=2175907 RepID=A0A8H6J6S9_9PEZI|nr:dimethylaniline monooxygenase 2 [Colletotrichum sojae]
MYAKHFSLYENNVLDATVEMIERDHENERWNVHITGEAVPRPFDKVVLASGSESKPVLPTIENLGQFQGRFMHSQAYKGRGAKVVPRMNKGRPVDSILSWRTSRISFWLEHYFPRVFGLVGDLVFRQTAKELGEQDPAWGFEPSPSIGIGLNVAVVSDDLFSRLREGRIQSIKGVSAIVGPDAVRLENGEVVEGVDVLIAATGYRPDFSLVPELSHAEPKAPSLPPLPNLYQNVFAVDHPGSLACTSYCVINNNAASYRELQSMAIAQVWAGKSSLPSDVEMRRQVAAYQKWLWGRF